MSAVSNYRTLNVAPAAQQLAGLATATIFILLIGCESPRSVTDATAEPPRTTQEESTGNRPTDEIVAEEAVAEDSIRIETDGSNNGPKQITFHVKGMGERLNLF